MVKSTSILLPSHLLLLSLTSLQPVSVTASPTAHLWTRMRAAVNEVLPSTPNPLWQWQSNQTPLDTSKSQEGVVVVVQEQPSERLKAATGIAVTSLLPAVTRTTVYAKTATPLPLPPPEAVVYDVEVEGEEEEEKVEDKESEKVTPSSPLHKRKASPARLTERQYSSNSGPQNQGYGNSGVGNVGNGNSGNYNCGNGNSGSYNDGNGNSGNYNVGNGQSGNGNAGGAGVCGNVVIQQSQAYVYPAPSTVVQYVAPVTSVMVVQYPQVYTSYVVYQQPPCTTVIYQQPQVVPIVAQQTTLPRGCAYWTSLGYTCSPASGVTDEMKRVMWSWVVMGSIFWGVAIARLM